MRLTLRAMLCILIGLVGSTDLGGKAPRQALPGGQGLTGGVLAMARGLGASLGPATAEAAEISTKGKKAGGPTSRKVVTAKHKMVKATPAKRKASKTPATAAKGSKSKAARRAAPQGAKTAKGAPRPKGSGRCEPQSLTYARQRSGIMRSRSGRENGPLTWFAAERRLGMTSPAPSPGSVLILGSDKGHGMPTGHVAYVEKTQAEGTSRYKVTFSHTNYDRKCSLETNIEALYDSAAMTLDIYSGAWQPWGRGLRVAGFILQD